MSMRVVECNVCGETLAAANDEELVQRLRTHIADEHAESGIDEAAAQDTIATEAYDASDS